MKRYSDKNNRSVARKRDNNDDGETVEIEHNKIKVSETIEVKRNNDDEFIDMRRIVNCNDEINEIKKNDNETTKIKLNDDNNHVTTETITLNNVKLCTIYVYDNKINLKNVLPSCICVFHIVLRLLSCIPYYIETIVF